jgi:general stress protein 26
MKGAGKALCGLRRANHIAPASLGRFPAQKVNPALPAPACAAGRKPHRFQAFGRHGIGKATTMTTHATAADLRKISDLIKGIKVAMLTSEDGGHLRSRPMVAAQKEFAGELLFFTRASAAKVEEVQADARVNVSYADADSQTYVSLSGTASVVRDPALIDAHWTEAMRTWFPKGRHDPDIAILNVAVEKAEYWDAPSSAMLYLYGYAKAVITGEPPHPGGNAKLDVA